MIYLSFVLWVVGCPLGCAIEDYLTEKRYALANIPRDEHSRNVAMSMCFFVWIVVAVFLGSYF